MNLQDFIKDVLVSIDKAVDLARNETKREISLMNTASQRTVEFDIAVSVEEGETKSGKAGIRVLQFVEGSADLSKENKNSTVSRIQFGVHIETLTKDEESRRDAQIRAANQKENGGYY